MCVCVCVCVCVCAGDEVREVVCNGICTWLTGRVVCLLELFLRTHPKRPITEKCGKLMTIMAPLP